MTDMLMTQVPEDPKPATTIKAQFFVWPDATDEKNIYGFHCTDVNMETITALHVVLTRLMSDVLRVGLIDPKAGEVKH